MIVKTGDIIHLDNYPVEHRKTKWAIVVADEMRWCFFINTENRSFYQCLSIKKEKYNFLKNNKHYISCNAPCKYDEKNITNKFGALDKEDLKRLQKHIRNVKTLSPHQYSIIKKSIQKEIDDR